MNCVCVRGWRYKSRNDTAHGSLIFFPVSLLPFLYGGAGLFLVGAGEGGVRRRGAEGEERRVHLLGAEATLLRDVLHSERCSALVYL